MRNFRLYLKSNSICYINTVVKNEVKNEDFDVYGIKIITFIFNINTLKKHKSSGIVKHFTAYFWVQLFSL